MDNREQILELVERFIQIADGLLEKGKIDNETYKELTFNKIKFLNNISRGKV